MGNAGRNAPAKSTIVLSADRQQSRVSARGLNPGYHPV